MDMHQVAGKQYLTLVSQTICHFREEEGSNSLAQMGLLVSLEDTRD